MPLDRLFLNRDGSAVSENLQPGYRVGVAPGFDVPADWFSRLAVNAGTEAEGNLLVARANWRSVRENELAALTQPTPSESQLSLFRLSEELRQRWWKTAESIGLAGDSDAYPAYAREVLDYLRTMALAVPADAACEAMITAPGQRTTRGGLEFSVDVRRGGGIIGGVNLGDEPTFLVFVNLPPAAMKAKCPSQDRWLAKTFLTECPEYPLVRLRLDPGDGYWLPPAGVVLDHSTEGQKEVGVILGVRGMG